MPEWRRTPRCSGSRPHRLCASKQLTGHYFVCSLPPSTQKQVLPADASCEDIEVDPNLGFLSTFVQNALQSGAAPYISEQERFAMGAVRPTHHENAADQTHSLRFAAYEPAVSRSEPVVETVNRDPSPVRGTSILCCLKSCICKIVEV